MIWTLALVTIGVVLVFLLSWALTTVIMIAVVLIALFVRGLLDEKKNRAAFRRELTELYGKLPMGYGKKKRIVPGGGRRMDRRQDGGAWMAESRFAVDEITWDELDMDAVFHRINYTFSQAGEEYLYGALHWLAEDTREAEKWECAVSYFGSHHQERVAVMELMAEIGKGSELSFSECLDRLRRSGKQRIARELAADALYLAAAFLALFHAGAGFCLLALIMIFQIITYFRARSGILPAVRSVAGMLRMTEGAGRLCRDLDRSVREDVERQFSVSLEDCVRKVRALKRGSFWVRQCGRTGSSPVSVCADYIRMLLHPDIIQFMLLQNKIAALEPALQSLYAFTGFLDSAVSIAMYRASLKRYCIPVLEGGRELVCGAAPGRAQEPVKSHGISAGLCMTEGYHPLLEEAVANSIAISPEKGVLLTGSNASGKSTFLKTVAVNLLLAQTIHTALAVRFTTPFCHVYTAMRSNDDIRKGMSSYMAEILSLKRILDAGKEAEKIPVFCFVDEVLRGTNTAERIAASTQILRSLRPPGVHCFAATHDRELTKLLAEEYDNYHFTEEIREGEITFPYRLLAGEADTSNAIRLLGVVGYDREIVERAAAQAAYFLKEGVWR